MSRMYEESTRHLHIEFYLRDPRQNKRKSEKEGRPIYDEMEMVRIRFVGDGKRVHCAPAHEKALRIMNEQGDFVGMSYIERFPKHYEAFLEQKEPPIDGAPISELPFLSASQVAEMKAINIRSVENLAELNSDGRKRIGMNALEITRKAQDWLDARAGDDVAGRLQEQNTLMQTQMAEMQAQIAKLTGVAPAASAPVPEETEAAVAPSPFQDMEAQDIKAWMKDRTGKTPMGNPSHEALIEMADAEVAKETAQAA